ncbi:hypothetical protein [Zavarzinia compransoris]|uniref:Uncharacterized protein n=1 Tax=Zavarzinia compransoris TaxID=1264899 RepID=A0A317E0P5_9PROT|nr:hypothetical protein [Zavarzinia compransoris]PWR19696.1 hypothetical protein DKG75_14610 [Zavarzinia compransoris]TDP43358.1 hypothetical protein DES42_11259 [Zavarzinia compransoris]
MIPRLPLILALGLAAAAPAGAADGPAGRYALDVDATYQKLVAAGNVDPKARSLLEQAKALLVLVFQNSTVSFVSGAAQGSKVSGTCSWRLAGTAIQLSQCQSATPGTPFNFTGTLSFDAAANAVAVSGAKAKAPVIYRAE